MIIIIAVLKYVTWRLIEGEINGLTTLAELVDELELVSFNHDVSLTCVVETRAVVAVTDAEEPADDVSLVVTCTRCSGWTWTVSPASVDKAANDNKITPLSSSAPWAKPSFYG